MEKKSKRIKLIDEVKFVQSWPEIWSKFEKYFRSTQKFKTNRFILFGFVSFFSMDSFWACFDLLFSILSTCVYRSLGKCVGFSVIFAINGNFFFCFFAYSIWCQHHKYLRLIIFLLWRKNCAKQNSLETKIKREYWKGNDSNFADEQIYCCNEAGKNWCNIKWKSQSKEAICEMMNNRIIITVNHLHELHKHTHTKTNKSPNHRKYLWICVWRSSFTSFCMCHSSFGVWVIPNSL